MLLIGWTVLRPKLISIVALNRIKTNFLVKFNKNRFIYKYFKAMDHMIDEINANHLRIINKIRDLEHKIQIIETSNNSKGDKQMVTADDIQQEKQRLINENNELKLQVNHLVTTLTQLEAKRDPNSALICSPTTDSMVNGSQAQEVTENSSELKTEDKKPIEKSEKKSAKKEPKPKAQNKSTGEEEKPLDASRLDLRVGRIVDVKKHPDADTLYVEKIDCGEDKPRTVVSGLVRFVPMEEMSNRLVVILCNLKPAKMRGVLSEAMVMCASSPDAVEILTPPEGSEPGDRVVFDKYPGTPDPQLNPKKKIWEQIAPDLKTDGECVATYKGEPFKIEAKGVVKAKSLANVAVK